MKRRGKSYRLAYITSYSLLLALSRDTLAFWLDYGRSISGKYRWVLKKESLMGVGHP
jgi:hypothetical protein